MNLYRVNLNLLVAFDALLKEQHVSKAGDRLYITQSAMSKLLSQCREIFDDPILVRTPKGMMPTERALVLHEQVREVLRRTEDIFSIPHVFKPSSHEQTVRIGMPEAIADFILPKLMNLIKPVAPNIKFHISHVDSTTVEKRLFNDDIQLAITYGFVLPELCKATNLMKYRPICLARRDHPLMKYKTIPVKQFLKYEHIVMIYHEAPTLLGDRFLKDHGYPERKIALTVTNAMMVLPIIEKTDLIFSIGEKFAEQFAKKFKLDYRPLPAEAPDIVVKLLWSPIYDSCIWHQWLRRFIRSIAF